MKSFDLERLVRENIRNLTPYRCARDDYDQGILLDANENSLGSVLADGSKLNRYPDPHQNELRDSIAAFRKIHREQIFCGVGSDEAIDLLIRIFCVPGKDSVLITPPTYGMYKVAARVNDIHLLEAPLTPQFQIDTGRIQSTLQPDTKIIFLCSPNNPTANNLNRDDIIRILESFSGLVVVDEAYIDFSTQESFTKELEKYPNLVILQTFSKSFGLAGIRLGLAFASEEIIGYMLKVKAPYNISKLTADAALRALKYIPNLQRSAKTLISERIRVEKGLKELPEVGQVFPSDANFLLVRIPDAFQIYKTMADAGIVIRYRGDQIHCENTVRITIGTPDENDKMLAMLKSLLTKS